MDIIIKFYEFPKPSKMDIDTKEKFMKLLVKCKSLGELNGTYEDYDKTQSIYIVTAKKNKHMCGYLIGSMYSTEHCYRPSQWRFSANRKRTLWISEMGVKEKGIGIGSSLLREFEKNMVDKNLFGGRHNIYVCSIHLSGGFYAKNGYTCIETKCDDELKDEDRGDELTTKNILESGDHDNPYTFEHEHGCWYG